MTDLTPEKINLLGLNRQELQKLLHPLGASPQQVENTFSALYYQGIKTFDELLLNPKIKTKLKASSYLHRPEVVEEQHAKDGTIKFLLKLEDGALIETVYIPTPNQKRGTLCISSQVGCTAKCQFCLTGTQLFVRNLTAAEIISQLVIVRDALGEWPTPFKDRRISTLVFMGMGEPLFNIDNVLAAIHLFSDSAGFAISKRQITVSTSGITPNIHRLEEAGPIIVALSQHAPNNAIRDRLMPINKKYPLSSVLEALKKLSTIRNAHRLVVEYLLLDGLNDQPEHALELLKTLDGFAVKFNLLPFNPWMGCPSFLRPSSPETMERFSEILYQAGYTATIRSSRGDDISAACGQLKSNTQRVPRYIQRQQKGIIEEEENPHV